MCDQVSLHSVLPHVNCQISSISNDELTKVTPAIVCEAIRHLKCNRNDLIHCQVSNILMLSMLIPLVKDKLGDICASNNYRLIIISIIVLKILDWVIILLQASQQASKPASQQARMPVNQQASKPANLFHVN